jgi:bacteriorhodopsin
MSIWLIFQIVAIASMPAAYDMARNRGRSAWIWLDVAMIFGPLALLALLVLGKRDSEAIWTGPRTGGVRRWL